MQFIPVAHEFYSSRSEGGKFLINSDSEWKSILGDNIAKDVNFDEFSAVAVFLGEKPTGGYDIKINSVIEEETAIRVYVEESSPGKKCMVTQAFTSPFEIVKIPKTGKEAYFDISRKITDC